MYESIPAVLLILGFLIIGYGLQKKDDRQARRDLGKNRAHAGRKRQRFIGHFIAGVATAAGLVLLLAKKG